MSAKDIVKVNSISRASVISVGGCQEEVLFVLLLFVGGGDLPAASTGCVLRP